MTTLTGVLNDSGGNPITGTLWLELSQAGYFNPGSILVTPLVPTVFTLAGGSISGPGAGPYAVYGNDGITPSTTWYRLTAFNEYGGQVLRKNVLITGVTADLGALVTAPTGTWIAGASSVHNSLSGRADADAHPATAISVTPAGAIVATTVQAALEELDTEKITTDGTARTGIQKAGVPVAARRNLNLIEGANVTLTVVDNAGAEAVDVTVAAAGGGGGATLADGDYGDITASVGGTILTVDPKAISYSKIQDVSAPARVLGRKTAGAGSPEELVIGADLQAYDVELAAIAGLTSAADRLPYFTGLGAAALATFPAFGRSLVAASSAAAARTTLEVAFHGIIRPEYHGGVADGAYNTAASITGGTPTLVLSGLPGAFAPGDVGKTIAVEGAGASSGLLVTTIAGYTSSTEVTLAANAGTTAVSGWAYWGTNNAACFASMAASAGQWTRIDLSGGSYVSTTALTLSGQGCTVSGAGKEATEITILSTTANGITWTGAGAGQVVQDLTIRGMGGLMTAGAGVGYSVGAHPYFKSGLRNVSILRFYDGVSMPSAGPTLYEAQNITIHESVRYGVNTAATWSLVGGQIYGFVAFHLSRFAISNGSTTLTASSATFSSHNVGDEVLIDGAISGGTVLKARITAVASSTSCTLASAATATVAAAHGSIGARMEVGWRQFDGGGYIANVDIIGGTKGIYLNAGTGAAVFAFICNNVLCDSQYDIGFQAEQSGTGGIYNVKMTACWFASAGAQLPVAGYVYQNVRLAFADPTYAKHFTFIGCENVNARAEGLYSDGVAGLTVEGGLFENGVAGLGQQVLIAGGRDLVFEGNRITKERYNAGVTSAYALNVVNTVGGAVSVQGNLLRAFSTAGYTGKAHTGTDVIVANNATLA